MPGYELSEAADRDLSEIYLYTFRTFGEAQADRYISKLKAMIEALVATPRIGPAYDGGPTQSVGEMRQFRCESHNIFYEVVDAGIFVVRILHVRMRAEDHLQDLN